MKLLQALQGQLNLKLKGRKVIMKMTRWITVVMMSIALTACGPKEVSDSDIDAGTTVETVETIVADTTEAGITAAEREEISAMEIKTETQEKSAEPQTDQENNSVYEDNFAVDTSAAAAFADKIKEAVADKDIEALADLTAFPVYVGIAEGGVETREAFLAFGVEKVFTPGLMESVKGADTSNLSPSMAGFSISKDGKSNIIFGVVEGRLAISGINYE